MLSSDSDADKTVFVGNLDSSVKEEILFELFLQAGPLRKVSIARDREGRRRSYGFVCYKHAEAVPYAIALLNGTWLYGRQIRLHYRAGSSHHDDGAGFTGMEDGPPQDKPSGNACLVDPSVFHFTGLPDGSCPSRNQLRWNNMAYGHPSERFSLAITPPQPQYSVPPSALFPCAPPQPWHIPGFAYWTPPLNLRPTQGQGEPPLALSSTHKAEGQTGQRGEEVGKHRKQRKSHERRHKHRSRHKV